MNKEPSFGKKSLTNGEILSILVASILIVGAFFLFINIYIVEVNGAEVPEDYLDVTEVIIESNEAQAVNEERHPSPRQSEEPTQQQTPDPTRAPTPEPTDAPTPLPTQTDEPVPSPEATALPDETPTPRTSETPVPMRTPEATSSPEPKPSPVRTSQPTETPRVTLSPVPSRVPNPSLNPGKSSDMLDASNATLSGKISPARPYELLAAKTDALSAIKANPSYFSSCTITGTITYSRFHADLDRFFVTVRGTTEKADSNGAFRILVTRTGVEDILLGFDKDIILKTSLDLNANEITKGFDITSIVPGLMRRRYFPSAKDEELFARIPEIIIGRGNEALKRVAITIDDGFSRDEKLLGLLKELGVRCTVFIIGGRNIGNANPEWIKTMDEMGFEVCSHSYTHSNVTLLTDSALEKELRQTQRIISNVTKKAYPYFRPPGGAYDRRSLATIAKNGYMLVNWSNTFGDTVPGNKTDKQVKYVLDNLENGDIILAHFGAYNTYEVMKRVVPEIRKRGYELVTLSELLEGL